MNRFFQLNVLIFLTLFAKAQTSVVLTVTDAKTDKAVVGATITLDQKKTILSDENGRATFPSFEKVLSLHISSAGYTAKDLEITPGQNQVKVSLTPVAFLLQPVEVNAIRAGEKSPFTKTEISKTFIEENNQGQDLPFLLNQTPNVVINSDAGTGIGYTGIYIRGTDATRINMTINGIPYNDAESQGTYFVDLPDLASSTSSIQVQRGVGTSSNGTGAFGATMNFSTNEYNDKFGIQLNNSFGSFDSWKNTVKLSTGLIKKHFTFDFRYSNIRSDGYIDRAWTRMQSGYASAAYWGEKTTIRFNVLLGHEKTYQAWNGVPQDSLATNRTYNQLGLEPNGTFYANQTDNYWQNQYQLFLNQKLGNNWLMNLAFFWVPGKGYYEEFKGDRLLSDYNIQPIKVNGVWDSISDLHRQLWLNNDFFGNIFSFQKKKNKNEFTIGGGWDRYTGAHYGQVVWTAIQPNIFSRYYYVDADKTNFNLYAKWQHQITKHFTGFADLQYRNVNYNIYGFEDAPTFSPIHAKYNFLNPKAGISYNNKNWSGYFSYAMANKEPNRNDFEANLTNLPKQEQLNDFEMNLRKRNLVKNLDLGATFYYMQYKNQLILTGQINSVGAYTRTNVPKSYRTGVEWEMNYHPKKWNLIYNLALSQNKIKNFTEYVDVYDANFNWTGQQAIYHGNTTIAFSPSIVQNFTLAFRPINNFDISMLGKQVGKIFMDNTSNNDKSLNAYFVNDIKAGYHIHSKTVKDVYLIFKVNNIFNVKYQANGYVYSYIVNPGNVYANENSYFPMAGTNFMATVNLKF